MKTHVLKGSKEEIVEGLTRISGDVREAIIFEEEPTSVAPETAPSLAMDIFGEMRAYMVDATRVDDSREAIYTPMSGE